MTDRTVETDAAMIDAAFVRFAADPDAIATTRRLLLRDRVGAALVGPLGSLLPPELPPPLERDWMDAVAVFVWVGETARSGHRSLASLLGQAASDPEYRGDIESGLQLALTAPREDLPRHLRWLTRMLGDAATRISWGQIVIDLGRWDDHDDEVQKTWARDYLRDRRDDGLEDGP